MPLAKTPAERYKSKADGGYGTISDYTLAFSFMA
jgi:hypothetical protein